MHRFLFFFISPVHPNKLILNFYTVIYLLMAGHKCTTRAFQFRCWFLGKLLNTFLEQLAENINFTYVCLINRYRYLAQIIPQRTHLHAHPHICRGHSALVHADSLRRSPEGDRRIRQKLRFKLRVKVSTLPWHRIEEYV